MTTRKTTVVHRKQTAFTLIEVLVVVAIISMLVAILLPTLAKAREQARRVKCLSNCSQMAKASTSFSVSHKGRMQLVAADICAIAADFDKDIYAYQKGVGPRNNIQFPDYRSLKSWPVALAAEMNITSLKRNEDYFLDESEWENGWPETDDIDYYNRVKGKYDIFYCPSDPLGVRQLRYPNEFHGILSYTVNTDALGVSIGHQEERFKTPDMRPICVGPRGGDKPSSPAGVVDLCVELGKMHQKPKAMGRVDSFVRPAEVCLYVDGGNELAEQLTEYDNSAGRVVGMRVLVELNTDYVHYCQIDFGATQPYKLGYLDGVLYDHAYVPWKRHGDDGGVCVAFADGHAAFCRGTGWINGPQVGVWPLRVAVNPPSPTSYKVVKEYSPRPRVTPYRP